MLPIKDEYAVRTLDFVERLQKLEKYEDICLEISNELNWFGFDCLTCMTMPGPGENLEDTIHLNTRPTEYVERYIEQNYVARDPVVTELKNNRGPYSWGDIKKKKLSKVENDIIDEAREFQVKDGLIIPIVSLSNSMSVFSPCGEDPLLTVRARSAVELIGMYSFQALKRSLIQQDQEDSTYTPLTPREREIMTWIAAGKSDDEIADILSIATTTVTSHVENSKHKLDAFKRTYAVVQAIRLGEIHI